jgi:acyl-CoA thioesterase I
MKPDQIYFFGDSITLADNDSARCGWPGRLCAGLEKEGTALTAYNLGINGDTSRDIAARWQAETAARRLRGNGMGTAAFVFAYGFNDACNPDGKGLQVALSEALKLSRTMLGAASAIGPVLWIGPTPLDESINPFVGGSGIVWDIRNRDIGAYSRAYGELAGEIGLPYLDLFTPFSTSERYARALAAYDGIHPADDGYAMITEAVAAWQPWRDLIG